jgi:hypothetical protein
VARSPRRLGVLGTFVWDSIWYGGTGEASPESREQWGGIAYSLSAASAACPRGWEIVPVARVGADLAENAFGFMESLPGVVPAEGVRVVPEANNRVELRYVDAAERTERLTGGVSAWPLRELAPLVQGLDALFINFISGFELDQRTAREITSIAGIPIYADLHSLFLGAPGPEPRRPRRLPQWKEWLAAFDAVQMNASELALLGPEREDPFEILSELPKLGPRLCLVTTGAEGSRFAAPPELGPPSTWPAGRGDPLLGESPRLGHVPAPSGPLPGDPTGCGDVWGAVAFCGLLGGFDLVSALTRANAAAAAKLALPEIELLQSHLALTLQSRRHPPGDAEIEHPISDAAQTDS